MEFVFDPCLVLYLPLYGLDRASFVSKDAYGHLCTVTGAAKRLNGRYFDGSDDWISVALHSALTSPTQGTIVVWFRQGTADSGRGLIQHSDKDTVGQNEAGLQVNATRFLQWRTDIVGGAGVQELRTDTNIYSLDAWVCVIVTSNGSTIEMDVDGVNRTLNEATGSNNGDWFGDLSNTDSIAIGSLRRPTSDYYMGDIGEVIVYNSHKSFPERQAIYHATKWRYR